MTRTVSLERCGYTGLSPEGTLWNRKRRTTFRQPIFVARPDARSSRRPWVATRPSSAGVCVRVVCLANAPKRPSAWPCSTTCCTPDRPTPSAARTELLELAWGRRSFARVDIHATTPVGQLFRSEHLLLILRAVSGPFDMSPFGVGGEKGERETWVKDAQHRRSRHTRSVCPVCRTWPAAWGWKSPVQPDGGEA